MISFDFLEHHKTLNRILEKVLKGEKDEYNAWQLKYELKLEHPEELVEELVIKLAEDKIVSSFEKKGFGSQPDSLFIGKNKRTKMFLDSGGYTKLYSDRVKEIAENDQIAKLDFEIKRLTIANLELSKKQWGRDISLTVVSLLIGAVITYGGILLDKRLSETDKVESSNPPYKAPHAESTYNQRSITPADTTNKQNNIDSIVPTDTI